MSESFASKCYNFCFLPLATDLWSSLQSEFMSLDDKALAELFQVSIIKGKLNEEKELIIKDLQKYEKIENELKNILLNL